MPAEKKTKRNPDAVRMRKKVQTAEGWKRTTAKVRGQKQKKAAAKGKKKTT